MKNTVSGNINTMSGNVNTISGNLNTIWGTLNLLNIQLNGPSAYLGLNTPTTPTQAIVNGNTIYLGSTTSNVYLKGN